MKVLSLVGARPQFVKESILYQEFARRGIEEIIVNSGQHYDLNMSDVFFKVLKIKKPDYNLEVGSGSHAEMTGKILIKFEKVVEKTQPDVIIVYGDTNTTLAGAIVGAKLKIKVAHVEAGIRMLPRDMPEEINRVLTDRISTYLFCPSEFAVNNLNDEGIKAGVYFTGDVMYDLYLKLESSFRFEVFEEQNLKENEFILLTLHRDYNVDNKTKLKAILESLGSISKEITIVFPIHPRTKKRIADFGFEKLTKGLKIIDPTDYLNLMGLTKKACKIITDSGGLQKEAYFAGKQAVVVMPDTGWVELIQNNCNKLANEDNLYDLVFEDISHQILPDIYGDGKAGQKIVDILID